MPVFDASVSVFIKEESFGEERIERIITKKYKKTADIKQGA